MKIMFYPPVLSKRFQNVIIGHLNVNSLRKKIAVVQWFLVNGCSFFLTSSRWCIRKLLISLLNWHFLDGKVSTCLKAVALQAVTSKGVMTEALNYYHKMTKI